MGVAGLDKIDSQANLCDLAVDIAYVCLLFASKYKSGAYHFCWYVLLVVVHKRRVMLLLVSAVSGSCSPSSSDSIVGVQRLKWRGGKNISPPVGS